MPSTPEYRNGLVKQIEAVMRDHCDPDALDFRRLHLWVNTGSIYTEEGLEEMNKC